MIDSMDSISTFQWGNEYLDTIDEGENWLIEPLLPAGGIINLYGKPKTGKSFAAIGMALAISGGLPLWNGFAVRSYGNVAYLQIDTPRPEWKSRFRKIRDAGYDVSKIGMMDMKMAPYPYNIILPQHQAWLREQLAAINPVVIIVDTLREAHEGNENDSTDMKKVINAIVKLAKGAAVIFVSHSRKDSAFNAAGVDADLMDEGRGSSYVSGRMDTIIKFTGKGKPMKGYMHYKGRSVEETKIPIIQEPGTGLIRLATDYAKQEEELMLMLQRETEFPTLRAMANALVNRGIFNNYKTAERHIKLMKEKSASQ